MSGVISVSTDGTHTGGGNDGESFLHRTSPPDVLWTRTNVSEAFPGVLTALTWSFVDQSSELAYRRGYVRLGAFPRRFASLNPWPDRINGIFFGRIAGNVEIVRSLADGIPGMSGADVEYGLMGSVRDGVVARPRRLRYPVVVAKLLSETARLPKQLPRVRSQTHDWWSTSVSAARPEAGTAELLAKLDEARNRFGSVMAHHTVASFIAQLAYARVARIVAAAGSPGLETQLLRGFRGYEEDELIRSLRDGAQDRAALERFISEFGFHGPMEGELSSRPWREDRRPVELLLGQYRSAEVGAGDAARRRSQQRHAWLELRPKLTRRQAIEARAFVRLATTFFPLREAGKATYLQCMDVARAAARALGQRACAAGDLDDPEDIFHLTIEELRRPSALYRGIATQRRLERDRFLAVTLPDTWVGQPNGSVPASVEGPLTGIPVCAGVATGRARVVHDPAVETLEPDEILVCATTDPSWAPLFPLAAGLVIEVGGPLSHGAIVARELGVPCVINVRGATSRITTGDQVRVDGTTGSVEILGASA